VFVAVVNYRAPARTPAIRQNIFLLEFMEIRHSLETLVENRDIVAAAAFFFCTAAADVAKRDARAFRISARARRTARAFIIAIARIFYAVTEYALGTALTVQSRTLRAAYTGVIAAARIFYAVTVRAFRDAGAA